MMKKRSFVVVGLSTIILVYLWYRYDILKTWSAILLMTDNNLIEPLVPDAFVEPKEELSGMPCAGFLS